MLSPEKRTVSGSAGSIVSRKEVSKEGAKLRVYSLKLSEEWSNRLTLKRAYGRSDEPRPKK